MRGRVIFLSSFLEYFFSKSLYNMFQNSNGFGGGGEPKAL